MIGVSVTKELKNLTNSQNFIPKYQPKQEHLKFSEYFSQYKTRKNHLFRRCIDVATMLLHRRLQDVVNWTNSRRHKSDVFKTSSIRRPQDVVNQTSVVTWMSSRRCQSDIFKTLQIRILQDIVNQTLFSRRSEDVLFGRRDLLKTSRRRLKEVCFCWVLHKSLIC